MSTVSKDKVFSSLLWKYLERGAAQGVTFIISVVLKRLLDPSDYALIALTTVFITISNVFIITGFNTALIQKKDVRDEDFSSVFYMGLAISIVLYGIIYMISPLVAEFYKKPQLTSILRVIAITLPFGAYNSVQNSYAIRQLKFKTLFLCTLTSSVVAGGVSIFCAYRGFGVWSLVVNTITSVVVTSIAMQFFVKWRLKLVFSFRRVKPLLSFGWKILVSELIDTGYTELYTLIIGKRYKADELAYYSTGQSLPKMISQNVNTSVSSVMLPVYAKLQNDAAGLKNAVRRAIRLGTFIFFPMMVGFAAVAEPFVMVVYTEKWAQAVPFIQVFCFAFLMYPINIANTQAINGIGRSDIYLKLNILKKVMGLLLLGVTMFISPMAIALGFMVSLYLNMVINATPNKKLFGYGFWEQLKDILPSLVLSLAMGAVVYLMNFLPVNYFVKLVVQVAAGVLSYLLFAYLFKFEQLAYILNIAKGFLPRKKRK